MKAQTHAAAIKAARDAIDRLPAWTCPLRFSADFIEHYRAATGDELDFDKPKHRRMIFKAYRAAQFATNVYIVMNEVDYDVPNIAA